MPAIKSVLALTLVLGLGALAEPCDKDHVYQSCQVPMMGKVLGTASKIGYTEGVCFPVIIEDEGDSSAGDAEVKYTYLCASRGTRV